MRSAVLQRDFIVLGRHTQTNILLSPLAFVAPNLGTERHSGSFVTSET